MVKRYHKYKCAFLPNIEGDLRDKSLTFKDVFNLKLKIKKKM